jgi:hypothetical protein
MENFEIVKDPLPSEISKELTVLANNIMKLNKLVARYKMEASLAKTATLRAEAKALITYKDEKNVSITKAMVASDSTVIGLQDKQNEAEAKLILATGELAANEAQFTAVRKQAELKKLELQSLGGTDI